ncbi:MAG: sensor histidine kinase [Deltaproteobacteria bacterium]|nr:sensor histidine kinase [Deltaproteobacteria bacterium]
MNRAQVAARLVVLVALAGVVPLLGIGSVAVETLRRRSEAAARETLSLVARQAAARIGGYLAAQREALRAVATAAGGADDAELRLEDVAIDAPSLGRLTLLDPGPLPAQRPAALDAQALDRARSGVEVTSEIYLDEGSAPALDLCVPVRSRPGRAVCAQLDLFELWRFVQRIKVGESGYALAFDRSGGLIASGAGALRAAILTGEPVPERDAALQASADPGAAPTRYPGPLGEEVLAGWAALPERGWTVVVEQPAAEALRAARTAQLVLAAVSLLALGLSVLVGVRQSRRVLADLEVEERWRTAGRIAAGITHDLGHRVAILQQTAGMAETGEAGYLPRIADNLRSEVATLRKFVADFADLSRDVRSVERLPLDLDAFAESVRRTAEPHAEKLGVRLAVQHSASGAWVMADRYLLERATLNLLSNAIEASVRGGEVRVEVETHGAEVGLAIVDRGAGIPAERLPRIFDAFASTKRTGAHVGLGLPNVKRIVEAHGGRVTAESRSGAGCTFRILLEHLEKPV